MIEIKLKKKLSFANGFMNLNVDFKFNSGDFITLYGPSGAGKTSILRMIVGLMDPDVGKISINDNLLLDSDQKINLKIQDRKIGFVFQDYALFPNMTIYQNLNYALEKGQNSSILKELIDIMQLGDLQNQHPNKLSGGQQQRVALARALVRKPDILMLDEPLSALDSEMRSNLQDYILKVHNEFKLSTILISHDISEIIKMADYVYVIKDGVFVKQGHPLKVFSGNRSNSKFQFTGKIIALNNNDIIQIATVLIGGDLVEIICNENFKVGDQILMSFSNINPVIQKLG